jgi:hypothetical protein
MKAALFISLFFVPGLAMARPDRANHQEPSCGTLMTEAECLRHRQTMQELGDPTARLAYLEQHMAMLREREVMCACTSERQVQARAQYR